MLLYPLDAILSHSVERLVHDMSYAFSYEVPGNPNIYAAVKAEIGPAVPAGLITQIVLQVERGLRHVMVWDSREDWERFRTIRVEPAVEKVLTSAGIPAPRERPAITTLDLVDVWGPGPVPEAQP
jgi:hypothetical protein